MINENSEFKHLQTTIKKYSLANSIHLIDYFLIIGYEDIYIKEKIIKEIQNKETPSSNKKTNIYKMKEYPSVLSSINSDYEGEIMDDDEIIQSIFPSGNINIYYNKGDNTDLDLSIKNLIFNKKDQNGFAYIFYEGITSSLPNMFQIFVPKIFVIISHYQFYSTFNKICKEIHNLFYSNNNQIPIELQLFNIINFVPVPVDKRLDLTLFPFYEKDVINKCQCNEEFISLEEQKIYSLERIKGYNLPEINIMELFEVISIDLFVEIYIEILKGNNVSLIYNDNAILSIIILLLNQFLFPLNIHDNNNIIKKNSSSDNEEYFYEFNQENKNNKIYLDINKKIIYSDNKDKNNEFSKKLEEYNNSELGEKINQLINNLKEIKEKHIRYPNLWDKSKKYNFFEMLNEKNTEEVNYEILNTFYKFNLYLCEHFCQFYFNKKEENNNDKEEEEKEFYNLFSSSVYSKIIKEKENSFISQKIILENILNYKNHFKNIELLNNLDSFDLIYKPKESGKFEPFSFLEFYKYYFANFQTYFNDIMDKNYIDCKKDENNIWYKYKTINLDKNILLKYNYLLEQIPLEDKNKCFIYFENNSISNLKSEIKIKDISHNFDLFLINNKAKSKT